MCVTMDRYEADWKIVERGWAAHVLGEAPHKFTDAGTAIKTLRVGTAGATTGGEGSLQALRARGRGYLCSPPLLAAAAHAAWPGRLPDAEGQPAPPTAQLT